MLHLDHLHIAFGDQTVVQDVSFSLRAGERLGIVGESGSGKSITALSIMGLLPPSARITDGHIALERGEQVEELTSLSEKKYRTVRGRRIGMVFQEPMRALNPVMRCGEQVAEAIRLHHPGSAAEVDQRTLYWMDKVGLTDLDRMQRAYPHQLSGGQKQRIMLAMALCGSPDILIADEPTTALDLRIQQRILALLQNLTEELKLALLFISHDLGVIRQLTDRVLVMQKGKVVDSGSTQALFQHPQSPYTRGLLACRPPLDRRVHRLPTIADFEKDPMFSPRLAVPPSRAVDGQKPILSARGIRVYFPGQRTLLGASRPVVKAVDGVDLDLMPGETMGLVGESGSGKTTLGRCLIGLQEPTSGTRLFHGRKLSRHQLRQPGVRRKLQIIFQDPYSALNPRLTIGQAMQGALMIGGNRASRRDRAVHLLEQVGLGADHLSRYPHQFSGGQRQRICIARALAAEPELLVCDEAVSALDVSVQAQVLNVLKDLQETHQLTLLFISHDLSVVRFMCDRVAVMRAGKIVEQADADTLFRAPTDTYTQELLSAVPA